MSEKKQPARNALARNASHIDASGSQSDAGGEQKSKKQLHIAVLKQTITLATSGFGLVAALAWNSAIQEFVTVYIKPYLPHGGGLISLLIYAILVTVIAVVVTVNLSQLIEKLEQ